jgi:hypothetical protein
MYEGAYANRAIDDIDSIAACKTVDSDTIKFLTKAIGGGPYI